MKPPPFAYARPATLEEALRILSDDEGAMALAGGQSLVPMLNMRLARPSTVVDLGRLPGLADFTADDGTLRIGPLVTHAALGRHPSVRSIRALADGISQIGYQAIRHRGTLGGSLAHADPAAELPSLAVALDATLTLSSTSGTQTVAADDFFVGYYSTTRGHDELITEVTIPTPPDLSTGFAEFSRRSGDFAVALAVTATWTGTGRREARVVVGGLDVRPRRLLEIETLLSEGGSAAALAGTSRDHVQTATDPSSDIHASADHRISLGLEMVRRSLSRMEATP